MKTVAMLKKLVSPFKVNGENRKVLKEYEEARKRFLEAP